MRTMLKATVPVAAGNAAIRDERMGKVLEAAAKNLRPEATYFYTENGKRTALFFFDMKDVSDIPSIGEPFFMELDAQVEITPVMNYDDLKTGLSKIAERVAQPV